MSERYEFVVNLAREAGEMVLNLREKHMDVSIKNDDPRDLVTNVDIEISNFITEKINEKFPGETIYSEEAPDVDIASSSLWTIDPIDGTANFAKGIPHYAVVIGYVENGVPNVGAIYNPVTQELFSFEKGKGAFLNGKVIKVSAVTELIDSVIIMTSGRKLEHWEWSKKLFSFLLGKANKLRSLSCSGLDVAFVAAGRVDACLYASLNTADITAALGTLKESGGIIEGQNGPVTEGYKGNQPIFVANNATLLSSIKAGL